MTFGEICKQAISLTKKDADASYKRIVNEYRDTLGKMNIRLQELFAKLSDVSPENRFTAAVQYNRLRDLIAALSDDYLVAAKRVGKETELAALASIENSYYRNTYAVNWATDKGVFAVLDPNVVGVSVYGTDNYWKAIKDSKLFGQAERYLPKGGTLLAELFTARNGKVLASIESAIRSGLMQGESYVKVAQRLRDIMETDAGSALRIARTETHRNMMAGQYAAAEAAKAQGVNARRMWVATLDDRVRESHASLDGQKEDENGLFHYGSRTTIAPGHFGVPEQDINCRCSVVLTVEDKPPELRRARDPATGESDIIGWTTFKDWAKENGLKYKQGRWTT